MSVGQARPLRWLIVAPYCAPPTGRFALASGERFKTLMTKLGPKATVPVPQGLGEACRGQVTLGFDRPKDFRLDEVVGRIEVLGQMVTLAKELERGSKVETVITKLRSMLGQGPLLQAIERINDGEPAEPPPPPATEAPAAPEPAATPSAASDTANAASAAGDGDAPKGGVSIDAIFDKAEVAEPAPPAAAEVAKSSIDAFIGAMRKSSGTRATKAVAAGSVARELAKFLRSAAQSTAVQLMNTPPIHAMETSWRGLRMVISSSPGADDLAIELLDSNEAEVLSLLQMRLDVAPMDRPDAIFLGIPIDSVTTLAAMAQLAAKASVPIVTEAPAELTGVSLDDPTSLPPIPEAWAQLRARPETAWLCVTTNPVVLANEEIGELQRTVFGSSTLAVAAMISASVGQTGGPGQIFGRAGALVGPASYRRGTGQRAVFLSTAQLATVDQQRALGRRGVLTLSCERGSDRLRLAAAPTVHAKEDDLTLPGRILAGRAARFARAVRDELPPHATEREVAARLAQLSGSFLPRSDGAVALEVRTDANGKVGVDASIGATLAGAAFKFSSDL